MRIVDGPNKIGYEESLRSIGALVDERGWRDVALIELEHDIIIQVTLPVGGERDHPELVTYLLTTDDIELLSRAGIAARRARRMGRARDEQGREDAGPGEPTVPDRPIAAGAAHASPDAKPGPPTVPDAGPASYPRRDATASDPTGRVLPFDPHHVRAAPAPAPSRAAPDPDTARAAVVMAGIVAAKLRSGTRLGGDDPDLASLLEQVRALDVGSIGS